MTPYTLNLLDLAATLLALRLGCTELNPLMRSVPVMLFYKIVVVGVLCVVLHHFAKGGNKAARWGLRVCSAAFAAASIWNTFIILIGGTDIWLSITS